MKKCMLVLLVAIHSFSALAAAGDADSNDTNSRRGRNSNNQQQPIKNENAKYCTEVLQAVAETQANPPVLLPAKYKADVQFCQGIDLAAKASGGNLRTGAETKTTLDGKITCQRKAGFTIDYEGCTKMISRYNSVLVAEKAMLATQQVMVSENAKKVQDEAARRTAQGDGQIAALDGMSKTAKSYETMNKTQAMAYGAAVGYLRSGLFSKMHTGGLWQGKNSDDFGVFCKGVTTSPGVTCVQSLEAAKAGGASDMFANDDAYSRFNAAAIELFGKAAIAMKLANENRSVGNAIDQSKKGFQGSDPTALDKCVINPLAKGCTGPGERVGQGDFGSTDFGPAADNGTQTFDMGAGTGDKFGDAATGTDLKNGDTVADVNNPFKNDAKIASGILDPIAPASASGGGSSAGGGGGGAGGGMGGGSAPTLAGTPADGSSKDNEVKTNKVAGNYSSKGGGGFTGVKGGKEEANPFASLFDAKSDGSGVESDDMAQDISRSPSSIFEQLTKKYVQMQDQKRIEATNLE